MLRRDVQTRAWLPVSSRGIGYAFGMNRGKHFLYGKYTGVFRISGTFDQRNVLVLLNSLPFRVFSVVKYYDKNVTRVEHFRDLLWVDVPTVMVPCWVNKGLRESTAKWFGSLWAGQRRWESDAGGVFSMGLKKQGAREGLVRCWAWHNS